MGELGLCTLTDILTEVYRQILIDITSDGGWPLLLVRFLHNKISYTLFFGARCYALYFDVLQFTNFLNPFLLPLIFYALAEKRKRRLLWITQFAFPLFFIFNPFHLNLWLKIQVFRGYYYMLAGTGMLKFLFRPKQKTRALTPSAPETVSRRQTVPG